MLNILSSSHSPLTHSPAHTEHTELISLPTHSPGRAKSCCPLRSLSRAWFFVLALGSVLGRWLGPVSRSVFRWFSAGSATGFSVAGFPLRVSLLVVLFGLWLSPRPLAISSRGWAWCRSRFFSFVGSAWSWFAFSARASFGLAGWLCPPVLFARPR